MGLIKLKTLLDKLGKLWYINIRNKQYKMNVLEADRGEEKYE